MTDLASVVVRTLGGKARGRRIKVGVFYRGNPTVVEALARLGYRTVVAGDRFRQLYRLRARVADDGFNPFTIVEASFDDLPFARGSLDALVLTRGFPRRPDPLRVLGFLRGLLSPGGVLLWPQPTKGGFRGAIGSLGAPARLGMMRARERHRLTELMMTAGFREVGQRPLTGMGATPWVVTSGTVGPQPLLALD